jgi:5-methylcytosine-specific restriction enzyme A
MKEAAKKKNRASLSAEGRASAEVAEIVFEYISEDKNSIKACAQLLANSISLAHQAGEQCWSLTLHVDGIRLNVGPVEVLVLRYEEVFLVLDGTNYNELAVSQINPFITAPEIYYPSVPGQQILCTLPAGKLDDFYPSVAEAHQTFILSAARRRKKSAWHASFSPGVISYLNQLLHISLPTPAYFSVKLESETIFPDEVVPANSYHEGVVSQALVNVYERDPKARKACIEHYGLNCTVCNFNFEAVYGERGSGFIHIHHLKPVSEGEYELNPINDLRPVCPNCHAMLHRYGLLSIEELKALVKDKAANKLKMT